MTTMTRFVPLRTPFEDVAGLQKRLNSIFNDFAGSVEASSGGFTPAVDVYEDADSLVLKLEVPGVKQEDLDIRLENQTLVIKGERKFEQTEKAENFHRIERRFGSFVRSFTLPQTVNTEDVRASADAGVLTISLPKKAEAQPKQIKVQVGSGAKQVEAQTAK
ncbi:Hsp20/alpha crystallin family protein [Tunturiibacter gelidiferens]|uniref:Hsp20/alpha crystallin family protein n=1 Tax=Tunturiibacter gelidiferens TaxID=3069689 RepID=UPI003D9B83DB